MKSVMNLICLAFLVSFVMAGIESTPLKSDEEEFVEAALQEIANIDDMITRFDFWDDLYGRNIGWFVGGLVLGAGVEVGVAFGSKYPCLGQISRGIESTYYISYYTVQLFEYLDEIFFTSILTYAQELYNVLAVDYCSRGFLYSPDLTTAREL